MDQLLDRLLARPSLQTAQLAGSAVRGELAQDPRRAFDGLYAWSAHANPFVRVASGVGLGVAAVMDRDVMGDVLPAIAQLAGDAEPDVRKHGAQAALEQLWLAHPDAMERVAEEWLRAAPGNSARDAQDGEPDAAQSETAREVMVRAIAGIAVGGQIRRPSFLRRFIERGLSLVDHAVPDASPALRSVIASAVSDIGCMAPDLAAPFVREWAMREDVGSLRLAAEIARLPLGELCDDVDFASAAARLRGQQAQLRIRAARWVRQGVGSVIYPPITVPQILEPQGDEHLPWAHAADPYRGCQLRCEFCNARSLSEWSGDDPDAFTRRVAVVRNAAETLARELSGDAILPRDRNVVAIGVTSDPYQPAEEKFEIVRDMLKVCLEKGHPVVIQTRQSLVVRDLDILEALAEQGLVNVLIALQTPIEGIRNKIELGTSTSAERCRAIGMLARKEVPVGVLLSPIMPELTDDPGILDETLRRAAEAGAQWAVAEPLNLRGSAGVKVRLFLENYIATLLPRYDEIYAATGRGTEPDAAWLRRLTEETLPEIRARHGLDDTSRMLTSGRDPAALMIRR